MFKKNKKVSKSKNELGEKLSFNELHDDVHQRIDRITSEFEEGFSFLKGCEKSVTFFGSARTLPSDEYYQKAKRLGKRIAEELGYAVLTGGGPGIMGAGNCGASEGKGKSVGFTIQLPMEQTTNPCVTDEVSFKYFFSRKVCMTYAAEAYVYFPGGFGTLDELFEILTLVQTEKIEPLPIILVGNQYFGDLAKFIRKHLLNDGMISPGDTDLFTITENEDEIIELIKNAPVRKSA